MLPHVIINVQSIKTFEGFQAKNAQSSALKRLDGLFIELRLCRQRLLPAELSEHLVQRLAYHIKGHAARRAMSSSRAGAMPAKVIKRMAATQKTLIGRDARRGDSTAGSIRYACLTTMR